MNDEIKVMNDEIKVMNDEIKGLNDETAKSLDCVAASQSEKIMCIRRFWYD